MQTGDAQPEVANLDVTPERPQVRLAALAGVLAAGFLVLSSGVESEAVRLRILSGFLLVLCQNSAGRLRSLPIVVVQHPAQPLMPFDTAVHGGGAALVIDQLVSEPLMIPLDVVVLRVLVVSQNWIVASLTLLRGSSGSEVRRVFHAARGDRDLGARWRPR